MRYIAIPTLIWVIVLTLCCMLPTPALQVSIQLPLGRTAYQTNEQISIAVIRRDVQALPASLLTFTVTGEDASVMTATFPLKAVAGDNAHATEFLALNGWLLRPGAYSLEAAVAGATAQAKIEVFTHLRKSSFKLIDWGCPTPGPLTPLLGEDSLGFNLIYGAYGGHDQNANIRGGLDYIRNCTMGGAHQMDMRLECDWSDPYALAGGRARAVRQALHDRTAPNVLGVHFYDEPGLTWLEHYKTKLFTGHGIPAQERAYQFAFGEEAPFYGDANVNDPASFAAWERWLRWKQGFMEGAWREAAAGVHQVRPDFIAATQSVYGWHAFGDGYYFNITRGLDVISGHGGYDDYAGGFMNQAFYHEMGRMRELEKPSWYLPTWWDMPATLYRLEQNLSFITDIQGLCKPPTRADEPTKLTSSEGIVETNKAYARLGTIFTTMPVTRSKVAVLYAMSQNVKAMLDSKDLMNFQDFPGQVERLEVLYFASKMSHISLFPIVEEDVLDGTLAANHKAVVLVGIQYLEPRVIASLEAYAAAGGTVILGDECTVPIKGAIKLGVSVTTHVYTEAGKLFKQGGEVGRLNGLIARRPGAYFTEAEPVAKALTARCAALGIHPFYACDNPYIAGARQAQGDVEYLFAVNAMPDDARAVKAKEMNAIQGTTATIRVPDDGRPLYDALVGGETPEFTQKKGECTANLRFGPGQMRVFARTTRPIARVVVQPPVISRDFTLTRNPLRVDCAITVVDKENLPLSGAIPLRIRVIDPLAVTRYDLFRATANGIGALSLPLAVNDPAGVWTIEVTELLANTSGKVAFSYTPPTQCGTLLSASRRAVLLSDDYEHIYNFFRTNRKVTIITGAGGYNAPAADRLVKILKPYGVQCTVMTATAANKPEPPPVDDELFSKMGGKNSWTGPGGFDVPGPALLLGTAEDNPLIRANLPSPAPYTGTLPYLPGPDFPGPGRGYLAWQLDVVRQGMESITLIAPDALGMDEAIGTLFEIMAGLSPATPMTLPSSCSLKAATQAPARTPEATLLWQAMLPDRAAWVTADGNGKIIAATLDESRVELDAAGKMISRKEITAREITAGPKLTAALGSLTNDRLVPNRIVKYVLAGPTGTAIAYWGGTLQVLDAAGKERTRQLLPQDISAMTWANTTLIVCLADGRMLALKDK